MQFILTASYSRTKTQGAWSMALHYICKTQGYVCTVCTFPHISRLSEVSTSQLVVVGALKASQVPAKIEVEKPCLSFFSPFQAVSSPFQAVSSRFKLFQARFKPFQAVSSYFKPVSSRFKLVPESLTMLSGLSTHPTPPPQLLPPSVSSDLCW